MKLALQQPYFFPYLGYFDLIRRVDRFVLFDTAQYRKQAWVNRNRIADGKGGWRYVSLPVSVPSHASPIRDVRISVPERAARRILGQLTCYRAARAPFIADAEEIVRASLADNLEAQLAPVLERSIRSVCAYLNITTEIRTLSSEPIDLPRAAAPDEWGALVCVASGASEYVNLPSGADFFAERKYSERGIGLTFLPFLSYRYATGDWPFIEHLSILDVIAWNGADAIRAELERRVSI